MWTFILLAHLLATAATSPAQDGELDLIEGTPRLAEIERDVHAVSYITNFKNMMADYVISQYNNLTVHETERIKTSLEEFLQGFAKDLHEIIISKKFEEQEVIADGIPDSTFDDVKQSIKTELVDVNEETANQIVYRLRKNLFNTRKKLDQIIKESKVAAIVNS